jgi:hypothetical protein
MDNLPLLNRSNQTSEGQEQPILVSLKGFEVNQIREIHNTQYKVLRLLPTKEKSDTKIIIIQNSKTPKSIADPGTKAK